MILITGATGQLGQLTIQSLLKSTPASQIIAGVRSVEKAQELANQGLALRHLDYDQPESIPAALVGVTTLVLISGNAVGQRTTQHQSVINAAKEAGITRIIYTSILNADTSPLSLAKEHLETETLIEQSGIPYIILRNGWYVENYKGLVGPALQYGQLIGASGDGKIAAASRQDYADAIVAAIHTKSPKPRYELAGTSAFTLTELAQEISIQSGKSVKYSNLTEAEYITTLTGVGLPQPIAEMLGNSEVGASQGGLYHPGSDFKELIGRDTVTLKAGVAILLQE